MRPSKRVKVMYAQTSEKFLVSVWMLITRGPFLHTCPAVKSMNISSESLSNLPNLLPTMMIILFWFFFKKKLAS